MTMHYSESPQDFEGHVRTSLESSTTYDEFILHMCASGYTKDVLNNIHKVFFQNIGIRAFMTIQLLKLWHQIQTGIEVNRINIQGILDGIKYVPSDVCTADEVENAVILMQNEVDIQQYVDDRLAETELVQLSLDEIYQIARLREELPEKLTSRQLHYRPVVLQFIFECVKDLVLYKGISMSELTQ